MTITSNTLFKAAGLAAAAAGLIFMGVQFNHPHLDATTIATANVVIRDCLKLLMSALALAGITGMYLRQVTKMGLVGFIGYVLFAAGYLSMMGTEYVAALVLPTLAPSATAYVNDVIAVSTSAPVTGDIGLLKFAMMFTAVGYLAGGCIFAIALFRANVLARWAAALLAIGTLATVGVSIMPQYERLFALPTGFALVGLGYSLWRLQRTPATTAASSAVAPVSRQLGTVGAH